jgi:hypothetical protein
MNADVIQQNGTDTANGKCLCELQRQLHEPSSSRYSEADPRELLTKAVAVVAAVSVPFCSSNPRSSAFKAFDVAG